MLLRNDCMVLLDVCMYVCLSVCVFGVPGVLLCFPELLSGTELTFLFLSFPPILCSFISFETSNGYFFHLLPRNLPERLIFVQGDPSLAALHCPSTPNRA